MLSKAKERPQQVKQVIDAVKAQGPVQTYRAVMKKLDAYSPLGYSCVGEIIGIGGQRTEVKESGSEFGVQGWGYCCLWGGQRRVMRR